MIENYIMIRNEINAIKEAIESLIHGSIEIREVGQSKFIYVHYRSAGILQTKYVGEYNDELANLIVRNNQKVKELNKKLKELTKKVQYFETEPFDLEERTKVNIDLARRNLVDSIYKQSMLEGVATTYSQTETLINGGKVTDMSGIDVQKVINLKHSWEFILDKDVIRCPTDYALLCQVNSLVEEGISYNAGRIRSTPVTIGGSSYIPPLPFEFQIKEDLENITKNHSYTDEEKGARLIAYIMKTQAFLDGNKRTAVIFGNHFLISRGLGLIVVPVDLLDEYKKLLIEYYEDKSDKIIKFFLEKCFIKL